MGIADRMCLNCIDRQLSRIDRGDLANQGDREITLGLFTFVELLIGRGKSFESCKRQYPLEIVFCELSQLWDIVSHAELRKEVCARHFALDCHPLLGHYPTDFAHTPPIGGVCTENG